MRAGGFLKTHPPVVLLVCYKPARCTHTSPRPPLLSQRRPLKRSASPLFLSLFLSLLLQRNSTLQECEQRVGDVETRRADEVIVSTHQTEARSLHSSACRDTVEKYKKTTGRQREDDGKTTKTTKTISRLEEHVYLQTLEERPHWSHRRKPRSIVPAAPDHAGPDGSFDEPLEAFWSASWS